MYYTAAEYGQSFQICSTEARGDVKSRIPETYSNTQPENPPDIIEQSPAGTPMQESYYPGYGDYQGDPFQEYRQRWHDMFYPGGDYQSENIDLNRNGWPDDEELGHEVNAKPKTEKPGKEEETTPAISSDKGSDDENKVDTKEDVGTGSEYLFPPFMLLLGRT